MASRVKEAAGAVERILLPRLNSIDGELKSINTRIDSVNAKTDSELKSINTRIDEMDKRMNVKFESVHSQIESVRTEVRTEIGSLRNEVRKEVGSLRNEVHGLSEKVDLVKDMEKL